MRVATLLLSFLAFSSTALAQQVPREALDAIRLTFPDHEPNSEFVAVGDLTNDGVPEVATLLGDPQHNKHEKRDFELRIAILSKTAAGQYATMALSRELPGNPLVFYFVKIEKKSLFLLTSGRDWADDYQFQFRNGVFVLIGEVASRFGPGDAPYERESFNYLTGKAVRSQTVGKHRTEQKGTFAVRPLVELTKFDLNDESFQTRPNQVHGYR